MTKKMLDDFAVNIHVHYLKTVCSLCPQEGMMPPIHSKQLVMLLSTISDRRLCQHQSALWQQDFHAWPSTAWLFT